MCEPEIIHCPYCGSNEIKIFKRVPRCLECRAVFFISFSRYMRKAPTEFRKP